MHMSCDDSQQFGVKLMERSLAVGATSGSLSAILFRFLSSALDSPCPAFDCDCDCLVCFDFLALIIQKLDIFTLLVGMWVSSVAFSSTPSWTWCISSGKAGLCGFALGLINWPRRDRFTSLHEPTPCLSGAAGFDCRETGLAGCRDWHWAVAQALRCW